MLNMELISLYSNISAIANLFAISLIIPSVLILFTLLAPIAFNKYKNLLLEISGLPIGNYVSTNSAFNI